MEQTIYNILREEHRKINGLLRKLLTSEGRNNSTQIFEDLKLEILTHADAENEILYNGIINRIEIDGEEEDVLLEAKEEHNSIERLIREVEEIEPTKPEWLKKIELIIESFNRHVEEEEEEIFAMAESVFDEETSKKLGQRFLTRKAEIGQQFQYQAAS